MSDDPNRYVTEINHVQAVQLKNDLIDQGLTFSQPQYTVFSARKSGLSVTYYQSGKLVIQGKGTKEFLEFYLEPNLLKTFNFTHGESTLDLTPRIGIDESGKGDFFGPLVVAGVYASGDDIATLKKLGVKDSKAMTDIAIQKLAVKIRKAVTHTVIRISPKRYNELYEQFKNLNKLLGWGHATAIESLATETGCHRAIIDQFAAEHVVETALKKKGLTIDLTQRHKGEEDLVVAAASILARDAFLNDLQKLSQEYDVLFAKGGFSPKIKKAGLTFLHKHGQSMFRHVAKLHFKTLDAILS